MFSSALLLLCSFMSLCPPQSTLFPYTTLFRSMNLGVNIFSSGDFGEAAAEFGRARDPAQVHLDLTDVEVLGPERPGGQVRSEEHTSELQSPMYLVCRLLLEKKNNNH